MLQSEIYSNFVIYHNILFNKNVLCFIVRYQEEKYLDKKNIHKKIQIMGLFSWLFLSTIYYNIIMYFTVCKLTTFTIPKKLQQQHKQEKMRKIYIVFSIPSDSFHPVFCVILYNYLQSTLEYKYK